ncbi:MAG TPA: DUF4192 family protein [Nonomuraea sp.]|nr:DUF4192 family protein [Nonomuraea sp.]
MDMPVLPGPHPAQPSDRIRQLTPPARRRARRAVEPPRPPAQEIVSQALIRLRRTIEHYRYGVAADDATAIRIAMDLHIVRVRDEAWLAVQAEPALLATMLADVAKRTEHAFLAPVGSLRAIAAWYQDDRDLTSRAIAEVLAVSPRYSMAHLLVALMRYEVPPEKVRERLGTPTELDLLMGPPRPAWLWPLHRSLRGYLD